MPGPDPADVAGPDQQPMARHLGVGRVVAQGPQEEGRHSQHPVKATQSAARLFAHGYRGAMRRSRIALRPGDRRVGVGQFDRHPRLDDLQHRDRRGRHVRRHLPQRRLHPDQDVRLRRRGGRRRSAIRPATASTRRVDKVRWPDIRDRIFGRIDAISAGGREYRAHGPNIDPVRGRGPLRRRRARWRCRPARRSPPTGSCWRPARAPSSRRRSPTAACRSTPPTRSCASTRCRARLAILGGGYIAAEFAHVFSALGSEVTVLCKYDRLLRDLDDDLSCALHRGRASGSGTCGSNVQSRPRRDASGRAAARPTPTARPSTPTCCSSRSGAMPNGDRLDPARGGVELEADGRIVVDEYQRTTAEGVWALGDVSSPYQLKHVANHEMRVVAHNLAHPDDLRKTDHRFVPSAVFSHPQLATVGRTEQELRAAGIALRQLPARSTARPPTAGRSRTPRSFCKLLADPASGQLLGAHLLGPDASSLIQLLIQAMANGQSVRGLARSQYWIHPALAEVDRERAARGRGAARPDQRRRVDDSADAESALRCAPWAPTPSPRSARRPSCSTCRSACRSPTGTTRGSCRCRAASRATSCASSSSARATIFAIKEATDRYVAARAHPAARARRGLGAGRRGVRHRASTAPPTPTTSRCRAC